MPTRNFNQMIQTPTKLLPAVLIVDDVAENLWLLEAIINKLNVRLIQANSGVEALEKTRKQELALAILDVRMPDMNGYELAMKLNKASRFGTIPVIFITAGIIDEKNLHVAYDAGAIDYINKPFKSHVLLSKIKIFLEIYKQKKTIQNDADKLKIAAQKLEMQNDELAQAIIEANKAFVMEEQISKKYTELYDFAPSGYFTLSVSGEILAVNLAGSQMLGTERAHLIRSTFGFFVSNDTFPVFNDFLQKIFTSTNKHHCKLTIASKGHKPVYAYLTGLCSENRKECLITMVDITDSKLAEDALEVSREKYKTMLNASPDGILLIDLKGIIREVSEIGLELLGFEEKAELTGKHYSRFMPPEERNTTSEIIEKTMSEGIAQNIEVRIKRKNTDILLSEISSTLIQGTDGTPDSLMITVRDISQRKKLEKTQIHADRMASLGEMASGIAHEINQPLNTMSMVMDNILFESSREENMKNEYLKKKSNKIFENITRIRNIIDHVRAFSRNADDYIATNFDVNASIQNAVSMISEQFKHLAIDLRLLLDENKPPIVGNTFKFEQVILNLLGNAKDALQEKGKIQPEFQDQFIEVKSYHENQFFVVEVTDNGTGISEQDIEHIMLPFYTTKDTGKGTGLGLSISYQIIKEMNGSIEILDNIYHGTTFKIILMIQNKE